MMQISDALRYKYAAQLPDGVVAVDDDKVYAKLREYGIPPEKATEYASLLMYGDYVWGAKEETVHSNTEIELLHIYTLPESLSKYAMWDVIAQGIWGGTIYHVLRSGIVECKSGDRLWYMKRHDREDNDDSTPYRRFEFPPPNERYHLMAMAQMPRSNISFDKSYEHKILEAYVTDKAESCFDDIQSMYFTMRFATKLHRVQVYARDENLSMPRFGCFVAETNTYNMISSARYIGIRASVVAQYIARVVNGLKDTPFQRVVFAYVENGRTEFLFLQRSGKFVTMQSSTGRYSLIDVSEPVGVEHVMSYATNVLEMDGRE